MISNQVALNDGTEKIHRPMKTGALNYGILAYFEAIENSFVNCVIFPKPCSFGNEMAAYFGTYKRHRTIELRVLK